MPQAPQELHQLVLGRRGLCEGSFDASARFGHFLTGHGYQALVEVKVQADATQDALPTREFVVCTGVSTKRHQHDEA